MHSEYCDGMTKVHANGNNIYFRKFEGYIATCIAVLADENMISFEILYWTNVAAFSLFELRNSIVRAVV